MSGTPEDKGRRLFWATIGVFAVCCLIGIVAVFLYPAPTEVGYRTGTGRWFALGLLLAALWVQAANRAHGVASLISAGLCAGAAQGAWFFSAFIAHDSATDAAEILRGIAWAPQASYLLTSSAVIAALAAAVLAFLPRPEPLPNDRSWPAERHRAAAVVSGVLIGVLAGSLVLPLTAVFDGPLQKLKQQSAIDEISDIRAERPAPGPPSDSPEADPGVVLWTQGRGELGYHDASIAIGHGLVLVLVTLQESIDVFSQGVIAYDLMNGDEVWRHIYKQEYLRGVISDQVSDHALILLEEVAVLIALESGETIRIVELPQFGGDRLGWSLVGEDPGTPRIQEMPTAVLVAHRGLGDYPVQNLLVIGVSLDSGSEVWRVTPTSERCRFASAQERGSEVTYLVEAGDDCGTVILRAMLRSDVPVRLHTIPPPQQAAGDPDADVRAVANSGGQPVLSLWWAQGAVPELVSISPEGVHRGPPPRAANPWTPARRPRHRRRRRSDHCSRRLDRLRS